MSKNSKAYRAAAEKVDHSSLYTPLQAAKLAKETSSTKQDSTVEVAIRLGVDPRKADQMVRGTVNLPHGTRADSWISTPRSPRLTRWPRSAGSHESSDRVA
jgi:ribosomal protein L1